MIGKILVKLNAWRLRLLEKKLEKEILKQQKKLLKFPERTTWEREQKAFMSAKLEAIIEERSKLLDIDIVRAEYADMHADYLELEEADARLLNDYHDLHRKYEYVCLELQETALRLKKLEDHEQKQNTVDVDPSLQGKFVFGTSPVAES